MAEFGHQGNNETPIAPYHLVGRIEQMPLDLSGLPTGSLSAQDDQNSVNGDDDEISARELFPPNPSGDVGLLADTALNATAYAPLHSSETYHSLSNLHERMEMLIESVHGNDDSARNENLAENPENMEVMLDVPEENTETQRPTSTSEFALHSQGSSSMPIVICISNLIQTVQPLRRHLTYLAR